MKGAALLNIATYEEVEADVSATAQAAIVVALAAAASAIGAMGSEQSDVLAALVSTLASWAVYAGLTYLIGDKVLGGTATWGELLRTLGFAQAPGVVLVLAVIPFLGEIIRVVVAFWVLATTFVAIRQALDVGNGKALVTAILGWIVMRLLEIVLSFGFTHLWT
jgi:hypothetical protein